MILISELGGWWCWWWWWFLDISVMWEEETDHDWFNYRGQMRWWRLTCWDVRWGERHGLASHSVMLWRTILTVLFRLTTHQHHTTTDQTTLDHTRPHHTTTDQTITSHHNVIPHHTTSYYIIQCTTSYHTITPHSQYNNNYYYTIISIKKK